MSDVLELKRKKLKLTEPVNEIGKRMPMKEAGEWVNRFQEENPKSSKAFLFGREILLDMLSDEECEGLWFYNAVNKEGRSRLVIYAADKDGDIIDTESKAINCGIANFDGGAADDSVDGPGGGNGDDDAQQ